MPTTFSLKAIARFLIPLTFHVTASFAQKNIPLPLELREETKPQLSGMTWHENRLYLLPQYLSNPGHSLAGDLFVYSVRTDSIQRVIDGADPGLTTCVPVRIRKAGRLPRDIHDHYGGFEAIAINGNRVFLVIESNRSGANNYLVCGTLNERKREINLHPKSVVRLKRFDETDNAGFESLAYNPRTKKLTAIYEFNAAAHANFAYEIKRKMRPAKKISIPFSYFRITDITNSNDTLFALNYHWGGDYATYLKNYYPANVPDSVPELRALLQQHPAYLEDRGRCFTKIMYLDPKGRNNWVTVMVVEDETSENNWEGLVRFKDGFLILSDSNDKGPLVTTLRYVPYPASLR